MEKVLLSASTNTSAPALTISEASCATLVSCAGLASRRKNSR